MNNHQPPTSEEFNNLSQAVVERSKVATTIIDKIRYSHDIQTIFTITTQEMRRVLECDRLVVYQFNYDWSGQVVAESVGSGWISLLIQPNNCEVLGSGHVQQERCLLRDWSQGEQGDIVRQDSYLQKTRGGKYARGQKFTVVDDIYTKELPDCYIRALETYQARAYVLIPIFQEDTKLWGLLGAYQNESTRTWTDSEIELMIQVSSQLGVALQHVEYINQLKLQTRDLEITVKELKLAQQQLIQHEKLAALGQLVAGVAHEINTPLGAIQASAGNNTKALVAAIAELPRILEHLNSRQRTLFFEMIENAIASKPIFSSSEKRPLKRQIANQLEEHQIDKARNIADPVN